MARRSWKRVGFNFEEEGFDFRIHDSKSSFDFCYWRMGYRESNLETIHPPYNYAKCITLPTRTIGIPFCRHNRLVTHVKWVGSVDALFPFCPAARAPPKRKEKPPTRSVVTSRKVNFILFFSFFSPFFKERNGGLRSSTGKRENVETDEREKE